MIPWGPADRDVLTRVDGGVTAAEGFLAGAATAGLKPSLRADLAVVGTDREVPAAAVTTTSRVKAAPCIVTERHIADGVAQAIVINAGNANACTPDGLEDADEMARATGRELGVGPSGVLVMSTGVIGVPLPIDKVRAALPAVVRDLSPDGGRRAAEAIMTTDTVPKETAYRITDDHGSCVVGGMAKGVGMIEPDMATLLAVITTDAPVGSTVLRQALRKSVAATLNRITVDGDGSTNDTVAVLAGQTASSPPGLAAFTTGLHAVCADLARAVVADGEGATRVAAVTVRSAPDTETADALGRAVATSPLVRAALHGGDPNWGRIMMAMGTAGVDFDPDRVMITCAGVTVCRFGVAAAFDRGRAIRAMDTDEIHIEIDLGVGRHEVTILTCDLTPEYVRFNAEYTT